MTQYRNTIKQYGLISKIWLWVMIVMLFVLLCLGASLEHASQATRAVLLPIHQSLGITFFGVIVFGLIWRCANPVPRLPGYMKKWAKITERAVHGVLYFMMIAIALTGMIAVLANKEALPLWGFSSIQLSFISPHPAFAHIMLLCHSILANVIILLLIVHVLMTLKRRLIDKEDVLKRITLSKK